MILGDHQNINHTSKLKELKNIGLEVFKTTESFNNWLNKPYLLVEDANLFHYSTYQSILRR